MLDVFLRLCSWMIVKLVIFNWEMIFEHPYCDNFSYNLLSQTHIVFLLSISIALVFVSILTFLYIFWLSNKLSQKVVVQITFLFSIIFKCWLTESIIVIWLNLWFSFDFLYNISFIFIFQYPDRSETHRRAYWSNIG